MDDKDPHLNHNVRFRRPRQRSMHGRQSSTSSSFGNWVMAGAVVYGAYQVGSIAYEWWCHQKRSGLPEEEEEGEGEVAFDAFVGDSRVATKRQINREKTQQHQLQARWRIRRRRLTQCGNDTATTLHDFVKLMKESIERRTDFSHHTKKLKEIKAARINARDESLSQTQTQSQSEDENRQQERELWDGIKVEAMTRMLTTAYAHTLLFLVLSVQVHLLGGKLFREQYGSNGNNNNGIQAIGGSTSTSTDTVTQQVVLSHTVRYFFDRGLPSLLSAIRRAVEEATSDWDAVEGSCAFDFAHAQMEHAIKRIRQSLETEGPSCTTRSSSWSQLNDRRSRPRTLMRFLMPPSSRLDTGALDEAALLILDETWDLLESPVLMDAQYECLDATMEEMRDSYWGRIFATSESRRDIGTIEPYVSKPLVQVLTQLKHTTKSFYQCPMETLNGGESNGNGNGCNATNSTNIRSVNPYVGIMETLPSVLELCDISFN